MIATEAEAMAETSKANENVFNENSMPLFYRTWIGFVTYCEALHICIPFQPWRR